MIKTSVHLRGKHAVAQAATQALCGRNVAMSRAIIALALLPAAAALDMCDNSEAYMPDAYFKSKCGLTSTADDISCPGLCSSGESLLTSSSINVARASSWWVSLDKTPPPPRAT